MTVGSDETESVWVLEASKESEATIEELSVLSEAAAVGETDSVTVGLVETLVPTMVCRRL